ncbi:TIGR02757 family protein [bacterium]|nr:TIGR02757 family protein [bacterium]
MKSIDEVRIDFYKEIFEELYKLYTHKEFINPDPLQFLYEYKDPADKEIVGLIASSLALGNVKQINKSVSVVLGKMDNPYNYLMNSSTDSLKRDFKDFKHRFITGDDLSYLLLGIKDVISRYGSLGACFSAGLKEIDPSILPALSKFVDELKTASNGRYNRLLPSPSDKSACKRLNLYLRWMVRKDDVDPGGWKNISANKLIIPLDTHMHQFGLLFGFTMRKQNDMKTALDITGVFRKISPSDPVKYDFALTRMGIRENIDNEKFLKRVLLSKLSTRKNNFSKVNNDTNILY